MASQAQIDANRKNAQRSTGPKSETGRFRAKLNALKDGAHAKTVSPVLPQEDPVVLEKRINQWFSDLNPRNDAERELVKSAANLSWELDRARRCETARLAKRVHEAQHKAAKRTKKEVGQLARRLLYNVGSKPLPTAGRPWEDNPAEFLAGLEESAQGCCWLLGRWKWLRVLLDRDSEWNYGDMFSLVRLLGKYPFDAINDPELNGILLAFDVVVPGRAERFWKECKQCKPTQDPGFSDFGRWREIADRPADAAAAGKFLCTLIDEQVARLEELLAAHEEIAGDEAAALADRASFDGSTGGERLRRSQTAKARGLRQTLQLLMKMQKGESNGQTDCDDGKMKDDKRAETETTTGIGGAGGNSSAGEREAGSAATPRAGKRRKEKSPSTAALEMVMSGRLDEQGYEKFFADPPAALVVIKGLQKLAELKVLPGRPLVAVRGDDESATSELGMKKARIEANGTESQVDGRQADKSHAVDSGAEKRSQLQTSSTEGALSRGRFSASRRLKSFERA